MRKVYILVLNWNSWRDTIECIESIFRLDYKNFQLVVIDNASEDNSIEHIKEFLTKKKLPFKIYEEEEVLCEKNSENDAFNGVILIKNKKNYGFAKGNNIALKFILKRGDFSFVWLLNNDAIIDKQALSSLVKVANKSDQIGFVGSVIRYYHKPDYIQAIGGGKFYPMLGLGKLYMKNKHVSVLKDLKSEEVNKNLDYIMGASLLIRKEVLEDIGIFDEDYFLYAEELDLITRAKKKGWKLAVALDSFVYHKESASTKDKKWIYFYYLNKSDIIYIKKHFGIHYALVSIPFIVLNTIRLTRSWKNIKASIRGVVDGIRSKSL